MTATIIQTNNQALQSVAVDGVTVDLIENALRNAREEMDAVLFRTAMSPGIREQGDCFPMIANVEGKMVVGQFGSFIGPFLSAYDAEIEEGDIILTNDPYLCNAAVSHLPDWVVLVPIFRNGRHIAWSAMFGHMSDNGGMVPGSIPNRGDNHLPRRHPYSTHQALQERCSSGRPLGANSAQRPNTAVEPIRPERAGCCLQYRGQACG
jgi:N-methylhydantoinase B